ncbi:MAG: polysaccharide deacetylase family protein [Planctomycetota bacterium]
MNGEEKIALTFDDGPDDGNSEKILAILEEHSVKAAFFMVGEQVKKYPKVAERIASRGHLIGNHSLTHGSLRKLSPGEIEKELSITQQIIADVTGVSPKIMRPPMGRVSFRVVEIAKRLGLKTVMWTKSAKDYKMRGVDSILKRLNSKNIKVGDIILCHDKYEDTANALPEILRDLKSNGYYFGLLN